MGPRTPLPRPGQLPRCVSDHLHTTLALPGHDQHGPLQGPSARRPLRDGGPRGPLAVGAPAPGAQGVSAAECPQWLPPPRQQQWQPLLAQHFALLALRRAVTLSAGLCLTAVSASAVFRVFLSSYIPRHSKNA